MRCKTLNIFRSINSFICSETNLDDVLQISNVFVNVSKGEVAKSNDLQKAFGTAEVAEIVKEVTVSLLCVSCSFLNQCDFLDPDEGRITSRRQGARTRSHIPAERNSDSRGREMRGSLDAAALPRWFDRKGNG